MLFEDLENLLESHNEEFDLDGTIKSTAKNAGLLDIKMVPEKANAVKVIVLFDVGGSMDPHVKICEELFSACKTEFKFKSILFSSNLFMKLFGKTIQEDTMKGSKPLNYFKKYIRLQNNIYWRRHYGSI